VPYMIILGGNEQESQTVALRGRDGEQEVMSLETAMEQLQAEVENQA